MGRWDKTPSKNYRGLKPFGSQPWASFPRLFSQTDVLSVILFNITETEPFAGFSRNRNDQKIGNEARIGLILKGNNLPG
jgi:hypothetical protein